MVGMGFRWLVLPMILIVTGVVHAWAAEPDGSKSLPKKQRKETQTVETIVVTAERFPVEEKETPRLVTVAYSDWLKTSGANNLVDALRRLGGLGYQAFAALGTSHGGMNSSVSIRGIKDGELVLVNGLPVQGAAGHGYDLDTIPVEQIERIEVMKGAASTLYGANAMSGVINIITKKPQQETQVRGSLGFGNHSYQNHNVSVFSSGVNVGLHYQHMGEQIEISRSFSKLYRYDQNEIDKFAWMLNTRLTEDLVLDYLGSYHETGFEKHHDDAGQESQYTDQSQQKNFAALRYETSRLMLELFGTHEVMRRKEMTALDQVDETQNSNSNLGFRGDYRLEISGWRIDMGTDWIYREADYPGTYEQRHRNDLAVFVQLKRIFQRRLIALLGMRQQFVIGNAGAASYQRFLPSVGLSYILSNASSLYANVGKAFRAPTFNHLYYDSSFLVGNPDLRPEQGWTFEVGLKLDHERVRLRLCGFSMMYDRKIEIDRSKGYPLTYINAGHYESHGIEWELGWFPFVGWSGSNWMRNLALTTSGYWADPAAEDAQRERYQTGPKLQSSLGFGYNSGGFVVDLNAQVLAARERNLDGYVVVNVYAKLHLWNGELFFSADNIFDEEVFVSGDMSADALNRYAYFEVGRLLKVGYEVHF